MYKRQGNEDNETFIPLWPSKSPTMEDLAKFLSMKIVLYKKGFLTSINIFDDFFLNIISVLIKIN